MIRTSRTLNLHHGINVSDAFMRKIEQSMLDRDADDSWPLIDPHTGKVVEVASARDIWQRILELRMQTGEPYLVFTDTANRVLPSWLKAQGLSRSTAPTSAREIFLPTHAGPHRPSAASPPSTSSTTTSGRDATEQFIDDAMEFLDNVLQYFIEHAPDGIRRARRTSGRCASVQRGPRRHGLSRLSAEARHRLRVRRHAKFTNRDMFRHIAAAVEKADARLCAERGPCPDAADSGVMRRFSHRMAVAPNASSSLIMRRHESLDRAAIVPTSTVRIRSPARYIVKNRYFVKAELAKRRHIEHG